MKTLNKTEEVRLLAQYKCVLMTSPRFQVLLWVLHFFLLDKLRQEKQKLGRWGASVKEIQEEERGGAGLLISIWAERQQTVLLLYIYPTVITQFYHRVSLKVSVNNADWHGIFLENTVFSFHVCIIINIKNSIDFYYGIALFYLLILHLSFSSLFWKLSRKEQ